MTLWLFSSLAMLAPMPGELPFPLRTDPPPKEWKLEQISEGLPYRWEKGPVYLLAWEVLEEKSELGKERSKRVLVLKKFDPSSEPVKHLWALATLDHNPKDEKRPWSREMLRVPPFPVGTEVRISSARMYGHEFYDNLPTDDEIDSFLNESGWRSRFETKRGLTIKDGKDVNFTAVTSLVEGGIDRTLWKKLFEREVPATHFPELKKPATEKR